MKRKVIPSLILFLATNALAVDGYKDYKFGMTKAQVKKMTTSCVLTDAPKTEGSAEGLTCSNFKFGEDRVEAAFFFVDGKLLRVAFTFPTTKIMGLIQGLKDKYGAPTSTSSKAQFEAVDTTPGTTAQLTFDHDTVTVLLSNDGGEQSLVLMYSSSEFNDALAKQQSKNLKSEL